MIPPRQDLSDYLDEPPTPARIERQWRALAAPIPEARPRWMPWFGATLATAAAVALVLVLGGQTASEPALTPDAIALSHVNAVEGATLEVVRATEQEVLLSLVEGTAEFGVNPEAESLTVIAGPYRVKSDGARSRVSVDPEDGSVTVSISEGEATIYRAQDGVRLEHVVAGGRWSSSAVVEHTVDDELVIDDSPEASPPSSLVEPEPEPAPSPSTTRRRSRGPAPGGPSAAERLRQARAAVARRDFREAAEALEGLLQRFPGDSRAGVAAFELGRIRLDHLGNPRGAARALRQARRTPSAAALADDIDARLVEAYERQGDHKRCLAAKERYLQRHPGGVHAAVVGRRCASSP